LRKSALPVEYFVNYKKHQIFAANSQLHHLNNDVKWKFLNFGKHVPVPLKNSIVIFVKRTPPKIQLPSLDIAKAIEPIH